MAQRADDIRHDIEDTRAAMTTKLAILEERVLETVTGAQASVEKIMEDVGGIVKDVKGTVEDVGDIVKDVRATVDTTLATVDTTLVALRQGVAGTQASVEETVEHMKGTIGDAVATVKHTFDLPAQVEHHPWPMLGGALLAGYMLGSWGGGRPSVAGSPRDIPGVEASRLGSPPASRASSARPQPQQGIVSGMLDQLKDEMKDEIASFQSVAVRAVMSTLREMCKQAISSLAPHTESAVSKPGGQPSDSPAQHPASMSRTAVNGAPSYSTRQ
jgi:hypothetical protein